MAESKWTNRLSRVSLVLALAALVIAFTGLTLARYDLVPKLAGFFALLGGGAVALGGLITGLIALGLNWKHGPASRRSALVGFILSLAFVAFLGSRPLAAGGAPALHDITTDLANPPQFRVLVVRSDNLAGIGTLENWRAMHARAYRDLKPVRISRPVEMVTEDAVRIAKDMGWAIAVSDPATGHVEATASVSYIRFQDDVVIRVTPSADGKGSIVDMRSVSRIGVGDLGVNAKRIRSFLAALKAA